MSLREKGSTKVRSSTVIRWGGPVAIVSGVFAMFSDLLGLTIYAPGLGEAANTGHQAVGSGVILFALTLLVVDMAGLYAGQPKPDGPRLIEIGYPLAEAREAEHRLVAPQEVLRSAAKYATGERGAEGEELRIVSQLRPASHLEALIEGGFALARVMPSDESKDDFYLTGVPRLARRAFSPLLGALAYVCGRLGYRPPQ